MLQLPASYTKRQGAKGLLHTALEHSRHRQAGVDDDEDANSPVRILERLRRKPPPPSPPSPPPLPPSPPFLPPPTAEVFAQEDEDYVYDPQHPFASTRALAHGAAMTSRGTLAPASGHSAFDMLRAVMRASTANVTSLADRGGLVPAMGAQPIWLYVLAGCSVLLLLGACVGCCLRSGTKKRRRRAQLEDINPVFQTETWRKLE